MKQVPEKNDIVTVASIRDGDRSYAETIWKIVAVNETHVKVKCVGGDDFWKKYAPRILVINDYQFSLADEFIVNDEDMIV